MKSDIRFDYHTHHKRCGHARGNIRDYIEAAIQKGINYIGISDHSPYFASEEDHPYPHITMRKSEFPEYVSEVLSLKEEYKGKINVMLGVEADFFPDHIDVYRKQLEKYPMDYIIGSVHFVNGTSIFNKQQWDGLCTKEKIAKKEAYYHLIEQSAKSGLFQILGHIDAMKGFYPDFTSIQTAALEHTLKVISEYDVAIEINTSGKTKDCGGWYPADEILEMALHYDVKVTFGSDAHDPERVGDDFNFVRQRLKDIGFKEWAYFQEKRRFLTSL